MLPNWIRSILDWIAPGLAARPTPRSAIQPHPEMTSDQGERRFVERAMEIQSQHVGRVPHPP